VNHNEFHTRLGVLLCINGAGISNRWIRNITGSQNSYQSLNAAASSVEVGSQGLMVLPFGNGAERMLKNKIIGAQVQNLDFNIHHTAHLARAVQEGIAFAFRYGLDIMRENGMQPAIIRAGKANMFLSEVFSNSFVNATGVPVELFEVDGSIGAALGAGVGIEFYENASSAFSKRKLLGFVEPSGNNRYEELYQEWKQILKLQLQKNELSIPAI
jgi:xylulokinase